MSSHTPSLASLVLGSPRFTDARLAAIATTNGPLAADTNAIALQRERLLAWISLYHAVGGGWTGPQ